MTIHISRKRGAWSLLTACLLLILTMALSSPSFAQEYEYEADEGLHQEEWYDPSDWFDTGEGIDYESDWNDYYYGYDSYDPWYGDDYVYDNYPSYDNDLYDYDYYTEDWYDSAVFDGWYEDTAM